MIETQRRNTIYTGRDMRVRVCMCVCATQGSTALLARRTADPLSKVFDVMMVRLQPPAVPSHQRCYSQGVPLLPTLHWLLEGFVDFRRQQRLLHFWVSS